MRNLRKVARLTRFRRKGSILGFILGLVAVAIFALVLIIKYS